MQQRRSFMLTAAAALGTLSVAPRGALAQGKAPVAIGVIGAGARKTSVRLYEDSPNTVLILVRGGGAERLYRAKLTARQMRLLSQPQADGTLSTNGVDISYRRRGDVIRYALSSDAGTTEATGRVSTEGLLVTIGLLAALVGLLLALVFPGGSGKAIDLIQFRYEGVQAEEIEIDEVSREDGDGVVSDPTCELQPPILC